MCDHKFTPIAPESATDDALIWKWCIRCGTLKLGENIFSPGDHQKHAIVADE